MSNHGLFGTQRARSPRLEPRPVLPQAVRVVTAPQLTASVNDYSPVGWDTCDVLRLSSSASWNITGFRVALDGRPRLLWNVGSFAIVLLNASTSSRANNRISMQMDVTLGANSTCVIQYDVTSQSWRVVAWAAPPGSTLLTTVTASASATVDFTASIDSTYRRYLVRIDGLRPATDATILMIRVSTDAGLTYKAGVADYSWVGTRNYSASGATAGDTSDSEIRLGSPGTSSNNFMSFTANEFGSINVNIGHPSSGGHVPIWGDGAWFAFGAGVGISQCVFGGIYLTAGAINGIRFLMSTGNIAQGVFRLYGQN